jgi:hypothetical protein
MYKTSNARIAREPVPPPKSAGASVLPSHLREEGDARLCGGAGKGGEGPHPLPHDSQFNYQP